VTDAEPCVHEREMTFPLGRFFFLTDLPCRQCEREQHEAWVESVRDRMADALAAAAAGEPFRWSEPVTEQDIVDRAAAEFGFEPWTVRPHRPDLAHIVVTGAERAAVEEQLLADLYAMQPAVDAALSGPMYPEAMGELLGKLLDPDPPPGPPWTHSFRPPPEEYDENGEPIPMPALPTHTPERFTAPKAGWHRFDGAARPEGAPSGLAEISVTNASAWLDLPRLKASVGERIRVNGPAPLVGVLKRTDVDEEANEARLWLDTADSPADPDSLDYCGPFNLMPVQTGFERPCSVHPGRVIGAHGCPRCREIRDHQLGRLHDPAADGHIEAEGTP